MEQIGGAVKTKVWHSNRPADDDDSSGAGAPKRMKSVAEVRAAKAKAAEEGEKATRKKTVQ
jgi:hypothetical protein